MEPGSRLLDRKGMFALSYAASFIGSKFIGFSSGYALDDYTVLSGEHPQGLLDFFLSQGRYTNGLLDLLLMASDLKMTNFSVVALLATLVFSLLFYMTVFAPRSNQRPSLVVAVAALLGAHSYYTEYVTFRQSALPMSIMFAMLWIGAVQYRLAVFDRNRTALRLLGALAAAVIAMGANQLALCLAGIAVLYMHMTESVTSQQAPSAAFKGTVRALVVTAAVGLALVVSNLAVAGAARSIAGVSKDTRATLISTSQLSERVDQLAELMPTLLVKAEPIASRPAKLLLLLSALVLLIPFNRKQLQDTWVALVFATTAWVIALLPHIVSGTWWPVPRTFIAIPMVFAGTICLLSQDRGWRAALSAALALSAAVLFCASSNAALLNQQRVNRWDISQAQAIATHVVERFPQNKGKMAIVGGKWAYPSAPGAVQGDMNVSALSVGWAIDPLFDEATGINLTVRSAPELSGECAGKAPFPSEEGTFAKGDEVIVCL